MYSNTQSSVQVNGSSSEPFKVVIRVHQGTVLRLLLFIIVMAALSREFRVICPWEVLVDLRNRHAAWKTSLESHVLHVNVDKTKILVSMGRT